MEPVEDAEGQGYMAEDGPSQDGVNRFLVLINVPLEKNGVHDVHCQVGYNQEHEGITSNFPLLERKGV